LKYYIVRKVSSVGGVVTYTPIGYVLTKENADAVMDFVLIGKVRQWIATNLSYLENGTLTADDFFKNELKNYFYVSDIITSSIDGTGLKEITDINNPEGVV